MKILMLFFTLTLLGCQSTNERPVQAAGEPITADDNVLIQADRHFLTEVERSNVQEQAVARLAIEKTQNEDIKDFAEMLVDDHTGALEKTNDLMSKHNIAHQTMLDNARSEVVDKFQGKTGVSFDREFIMMMVEKHRQAVEKFRMQGNSGRDNDVVNFAKDLLPTLEKHLKHAEELAGKV